MIKNNDKVEAYQVSSMLFSWQGKADMVVVRSNDDMAADRSSG
jgi:hypothetical protein